MAWAYDPLYRRTALLLPFDSDLADRSALGATATVNGSVTLSSAQSVFGGNSALFGGGTARVDISGAYINNSTEWTFDAWLYVTDLTANRTVYDSRPSVGANGHYITISSAGVVAFGIAGSFAEATASGFVAGQWIHLRCCEQYDSNSGDRHIYLNGVRASSESYAGVALTDSAASAKLGLNAASSAPYVGYMDDVRIVNGFCAARNRLASFPAPWDGFATASGDSAIGLPVASVKQTFAPTWPGSKQVAQPPTKLRNVYYGGFGRINGTVKIKGTPNFAVFREVRLHHEKTGVCLASTWSDPVTGNYEFSGYDPTQKYTVVAYDYVHNFRAVIADNLTPDPM